MLILLNRVAYNSSAWYHNAGFVPARILLKHPELAHVVEKELGTEILAYELYGQDKPRFRNEIPPPNHDWDGWKYYKSIHLLIGHRFYLDPHSPIKNFTEKNIWDYNQAYGEMCRTILKKANLFLPRNEENYWP